MNDDKFHELWKDGFPPGQDRTEWFLFLTYMSDYWRLNGTNFPLVVEIGIRRGRQKRFWQELGATYIGIDISDRYADPEIFGNSHDHTTFLRLEARINLIRPGGIADLIFIDGDHSYLGVKQDLEMYGDLAHMVAIHDIHCLRCDVQVGEFWMSLRKKSQKMEKGFTFIEFFYPSPPDNYGIGLILKEI